MRAQAKKRLKNAWSVIKAVGTAVAAAVGAYKAASK